MFGLRPYLRDFRSPSDRRPQASVSVSLTSPDVVSLERTFAGTGAHCSKLADRNAFLCADRRVQMVAIAERSLRGSARQYLRMVAVGSRSPASDTFKSFPKS